LRISGAWPTRLVFWASVALVAWLSLDSGPPLPLEISDKVLHFAAYAWLGLTAMMSYPSWAWPPSARASRSCSSG
jgi:hypothetical protein